MRLCKDFSWMALFKLRWKWIFFFFPDVYSRKQFTYMMHQFSTVHISMYVVYNAVPIYKDRFDVLQFIHYNMHFIT